MYMYKCIYIHRYANVYCNNAKYDRTGKGDKPRTEKGDNRRTGPARPEKETIGGPSKGDKQRTKHRYKVEL